MKAAVTIQSSVPLVLAYLRKPSLSVPFLYMQIKGKQSIANNNEFFFL
jgi:hypothetical protein